MAEVHKKYNKINAYMYMYVHACMYVRTYQPISYIDAIHIHVHVQTVKPQDLKRNYGGTNKVTQSNFTK